MSSGIRRPWAEAVAIAQPLALQLVPVCEPGRVKLAGSLRRRREDVGDIEIVAQVRMVEPPADSQEDLLGADGPAPALVPDVASVVAVASSWGRVLQSGSRYTRVELPDGTLVDLYLVHDGSTWGSALAIRTGPATLSKWAVTRLHDSGLHQEEMRVLDRAGKVTPVPDEETFFRLAGLPCLPPEQRDTDAARKPFEELLLVDLANLLNRALYTMKDPSLAGLGPWAWQLLGNTLRRWKPARLIVVMEGDGPSAAAAAIPGYKADRAPREGFSTREMTEAVWPYLDERGVSMRAAEGQEADHSIATLTAAAVEQGLRVSILSKDTDLLQLVDDRRGVRVLWPRTSEQGGGELAMDEAAVRAYLAQHKEIGQTLAPAQLLDLRTIAGGKDNLPRIEIRDADVRPPYGFTTKRAAELLAQGATLDSLVAGEHGHLLRGKEASWIADGGAVALARREVLRLRTGLQLESNGRHTAVSRLRLNGASPAPTPSEAAPSAVKPSLTEVLAGDCVQIRPETGERCDFPASVHSPGFCHPCRARAAGYSLSVVTVACAGGCGAQIQPEPMCEPEMQFCPTCATAWWREWHAVEAQRRLGAGLCPRCGWPLDEAAKLFGEGDAPLCSRCGVRARAGRTPAEAQSV